VAIFQWIASLWGRVTGPGVISPEEIEGALHLPVLAIIPHIERRKTQAPTNGSRLRRIDLEGRWRSRLISNLSEKHPAVQAYQALVKDLHERARSRRQKVWLLASGVAGEGTSLTCMNLAIAAHLRGIKTLIIEGHTRAPRISRVFRMALEPGLTGCLNRSLSLSHAIRPSTIPDVNVLPAGHTVAYPETLWGTPAFHRLLAEARSLYELVLLEGPPVLLYPDVQVLVDKVDGIVLVHQFGRTPPERVKKVIEKLGERQDHLLGVLLNDVPAH
jgi:capsular exopolysaccharide synthesis family protein